MRLAILASLALFVHPLFGQQTGEQPTSQAYRVDYTVVITDSGKELKKLGFSLRLQDGAQGNIRESTRVHFMAPPPNQGTFQIVEVSLSLRCRLKTSGQQVLVNSDVGITEVGEQQDTAPPMVNTFFTDGEAAVPEGEVTKVAVSDSLETGRHYEIDVKVTKVE